MSTNTSQDIFLNVLRTTFNNWTAYQLALTHNFAGSKTKEIADWFLDATYQWIKENDDLEDYELEEFFEETMNTEFNSILEDDSAIQISRLLLNYRQMIKKNQLNELNEDLQKRFPNNNNNRAENTVNSSIKVKNQADDTSTSESEDDDDIDDNNNLMSVDQAAAAQSMNKSNQLTEKEAEDYQMVEDGWTFVAKSGKILKK